MAFQLPPLPQQVGVFDHFIARQTETMVLREKILSLSGDSFDIKLSTPQGQQMPLLRVQGQVLSLSGRKAVFDMAGNHLFDICKELFHLHSTYACLDPQGEQVPRGPKQDFTYVPTTTAAGRGTTWADAARPHVKSSAPRPRPPSRPPAPASRSRSS